MPRLFLIAAVSYLLGSIPFGYLLIRIFRGEDVRLSGSGNIGATNVSRKSPTLGALTLALDAAKGALAVQFAASSWHFVQNDPRDHLMMTVAALLAIVGHMFPVWLRFRGGKGVATAFGAFLRFSPISALAAVVVFVVFAAMSRRISVGSIVSAALFPIVTWFVVSRDPWTIVMISTAALLIVVRHHQNMRRLLSGKEPRFSLGHK